MYFSKLTNWLVIGISVFLYLYSLIHLILRQKDRMRLYRQAVQKKKDTGLKLLVIGAPASGKGSKFMSLFTENYGYGDICLDIVGCEGKPDMCIEIKGDLTEQLQSNSLLQNQKYVVYISCLLEYIDSDKLPYILERIKELSDDYKNLYCVTVSQYDINAGYSYYDDYTHTKNLIHYEQEINGDGKYLTFFPISRTKYLMYRIAKEIFLYSSIAFYSFFIFNLFVKI